MYLETLLSVFGNRRWCWGNQIVSLMKNNPQMIAKKEFTENFSLRSEFLPGEYKIHQMCERRRTNEINQYKTLKEKSVPDLNWLVLCI